ncbi:ribonuclease H-like domain-containing protein [Tanacetum coccineum]
MVACLERSDKNAEFHQIVDFLTTSSIHYALTVSPTIYASYIEQFWATSKSKTVNDVKQIHATVDDKIVVISESLVRSDLHFNDEDGITCLLNDEIFVNLALMGYERVSTKLTFQKAFFSPQWKYLIHTILHCLNSKTTAWNEFSTNLASTIALAEPFNDIYVTHVHTKKVFTNMKRQNKDFSGRITPLFASMLVPEVVEGEGSGQPSEPQPPSSTAPPSQVTTVATQHQKTHKPRRAKRDRDTKIPQSSGPSKKVGDEAVYTREDNRVVRAATTASSLEAEQESGNIHKTRPTSTLNEPSPQGLSSEGNTSRSGEDNMEHQVDLMDFVQPTPHDSPLLEVLALENSKTAQDLVIQKLKKRVKRLEKALRARTLGMKLFKIGTSRRKGLDKENVSKQGRKSNKTKPMFNDSDFDVLDDAMENVEGGSTAEQITTAGDTLNTASINVSVAGPSHVSTAGPSNVSAAGPSTSTAGDIFEDEMTTIADTLVAIRSARPRTTSVMIRNVEEEPRRATPVPTVQSQDKGKGKMVEPEPTPKNLRKAQIQMDEELAQRLFEEEQAQFEKEQRIAREKAAEQEAKDAALIEQMEDARFLVETIAARKKFFAAQRAAEIRNRPPTRTQLRNQMITYLKHMGKYTHNQLKSKSFEEIQKLYKKEQQWINDFVPMSDDSGKKDDSSSKQAESSKKRPRAEHDEESVKKQKLQDDAEKEELRACLDIVQGDDIAFNVESLATKYLIVDWKTHILTENMMYYQIIKADGSSKNYKIFSEMLDDFDRQDVMDLHRFIKERLFDSCGVHVLLMDNGIDIHMMIERKYPLTQEMLSRMLNRRLEADHEKVIMNGDAPAIASASTEGPIPPKTAEQKLARKNKLKAKSTLLLAIPDEYLLKFYGTKDAKTLWKAIKTSQLEIHGVVISQEDANLKLLRSLPLAWTNIALIMKNKSDLDTMSMDDLYNNLKVYEAEIKSQSSSSLNSQNVAFVSSENTSSTNEAVNTAHKVSTSNSQGQASSLSYADDVMFSFFVNQSNSQQLDNKDLEQIDTDDLEEMDLKWQVAMLTMRVKRFLKKTGRNLNFNGKETVGFDKTKVKCYNCHRRSHFAIECKAPRNQGNRNGDVLRRIVPIETPENALVVQDGIGSSSSSSLDYEVFTCSKACLKSYESLKEHFDKQKEQLKKSNLEIIGYQLGLESFEARIVVYKKNEVVYEEDIAVLKYDVKVRDNSITELKNQLAEALREKDDLKLKLEMFETSSKNLTDLLNSQISNNSKVFESASDSSVNEIKEENNQINDRFKKVEGYHAVPPPYTGNYMPSRPDLSFDGLDDSVYKTNVSETITSVPRNESTASKSSKDNLEQPKDVRPNALIIEEWESDGDDDCMIRPSFE